MIAHGLTKAQLSAVESLVALWGTRKLVLIGARALGCHLPLTWRLTEDLDLTVSITLEEYPSGLETIPGWRQDPRATKRWYTDQDVRLDILPIGRAGRALDSIDWPGEVRSMNATGLRLATDHAQLLRLDGGLTVQVAPVPVLAVLKMISYKDHPVVRERDLRDLAHVLAEYPDDDIRFEHVARVELNYDEIGPFLLGEQIAALELLPAESRLVTRFLELVEQDDSVAGRLSTEIGRPNPEVARSLVTALRGGLRSAESPAAG